MDSLPLSHQGSPEALVTDILKSFRSICTWPFGVHHKTISATKNWRALFFSNQLSSKMLETESNERNIISGRGIGQEETK